MSWGLITDDWRIKLLALGLAVLMLGAVAFSQNPPTTGTLSVPLNYSFGPGIVLIDPPTKVNVTYSGPADAFKNVTVNNLTATVDASHAHPGQGVKLNVTASTSVPGGIIVQNPFPIVVSIDELATKEIQVNVNPPRAAPGWAVTEAVAICQGAQKSNPCYINFTGPKSWETNLQATVNFPNPVNFTGPTQTPNQPVQLSNSSGALNLNAPENRTIPASFLDFPTVTVEVKAVAGSNFSTVPLVDSAPSHGPPPGYRITGITTTPASVIISGDPGILGRIQRITLPPVDLSHSTSDVTFQVAITYPDGTTGNTPNALVRYSISPNPSVSSPSPSP